MYIYMYIKRERERTLLEPYKTQKLIHHSLRSPWFLFVPVSLISSACVPLLVICQSAVSLLTGPCNKNRIQLKDYISQESH